VTREIKVFLPLSASVADVKAEVGKLCSNFKGYIGLPDISLFMAGNNKSNPHLLLAL